MLRLALVAATLCLFALSAKSQVPKTKDLWFAPSPDWENIYPGKSADYQKLFDNPNEWPITYQTAKVFVLNVHFASQGPSGELTKVINFVDKSRMVLAATFPGMLRGSNDCGRGLEGFYGAAGVPRLEAERLASLGAKLGYAVIDSA